MNEKKLQVSYSKVVFFQTPYIVGHPVVSTPHFETQYLARNLLPYPPNLEWLRRGKLLEGTQGNRSPRRGPVAQRIRARGYEPRCRGFESLLAQDPSKSKREGPLPFCLGIGRF
eukprot:TRINITY_DN6189_c0_g2_i2.p1 TRINITY_DN6189_c0_g2~~TRINITY_DN6189_c0_g2_i2.p1  ORF type:complete len:114 (+),score=4.58 TRINITY_DN6189_c0_g2_i2:192-533(+)